MALYTLNVSSSRTAAQPLPHQLYVQVALPVVLDFTARLPVLSSPIQTTASLVTMKGPALQPVLASAQ